MTFINHISFKKIIFFKYYYLFAFGLFYSSDMKNTRDIEKKMKLKPVFGGFETRLIFC